MNRVAAESMSKNRGPPRHPGRDASAGQGIGTAPSGSEGWGADNRQEAYRPTVAQQFSGTSCPGMSPPQYTREPGVPPPNPYDPVIAPPHATAETGDTTIPSDAPHTTTGPTALRGDETATLAEYPYSVYNHGTWSAADDHTLIEARARGQNWGELQRAHFPSKTANACRKRYERLVERRGIYDYSARRLEVVASEYMGMRREIWGGLAERMGMRWDVVEALCMSAGLRTIQSNARSYSNRARRDNRILRKAREGHGEVMAVGSVDLPPPVAHPRGPGFGTGFPGHGVQPEKVDRNPLLTGTGSRGNAGMMPPPPFIPTSGPPLAGPLPPVSHVSFGGYLNGKSRPAGGTSYQTSAPPEPPPTRGSGSGFRDANSRRPA